ncbi:Vitamin B12 ABC transporter, B12-binding component BtuF [Minicystis rosea]|nr:Vitamin B12 ABC transporter, B12-binding component BtuF [Minicystis rosea]
MIGSPPRAAADVTTPAAANASKSRHFVRIPRRAALASLLALLTLGAAACSRGERVAGAPRLVSLSPSTTEAVYAIGAGALLAGRSSYCDYPPEAMKLPIVGGYSDPSVEKIVALRPTLVVGARGPAGPALERALEKHGIATFFPETESIAQIETMLVDLGRRVGHDAGAAAAVAAIEAQRKQVAAAIAGRPRVKAIFLFDVGPIVAAGPGSFPDALIREAGGENLITVGGPYPTLDLEKILALDPDVLLDGASDMAESGSRVAALRDAPGWKTLRALRENRARSIMASTSLRPGPRIGDGLVAVARALHGDALALAPVKAP